MGATLVAGLGTMGAAHAAPAEDCAQPFPVADLAVGDAVDGLTVSSGTTPSAFTGEVLGVLADGISAGRDMIMMELDSPAIADAGGIWQGMSGSPVYAEDGRLIGAVAYGLAYGTTPIAGVTPFEYMDDYLGPAAEAGRIQVGRKAAERLAATGEVTRAQAAQGFRRLPVPVTLSGVDASRVDGIRAKRYLPDGVSTVGAAAADASIDTVIAGGNLAAVQSTGDVTYAGIGTATSVCGGRIVGFGHPMDFIGEVSYGLGAADAIYVQEDPLGVPFKVANLGEVGGTITDDRLSGIAGDVGVLPPSSVVTSDLIFNGTNRVGSTEVYEPLALGNVGFYGHLRNHDAVMDEVSSGSELQTFTIDGTDANGRAFTITHTDRVRSTYDIAEEASYPFADSLSGLSGIENISVDSAGIVAEVTDDDSAYRVRTIEQRVGGKWVDVTKKRATVKAGTTLRLRVTVGSGATTKVVRMDQTIAKKYAGTKGSLSLAGGDGYLEAWGVGSLAELRKVLAADARNDAVTMEGVLKGKGKKLKVARESSPLDKVVVGRKSVQVVVR